MAKTMSEPETTTASAEGATQKDSNTSERAQTSIQAAEDKNTTVIPQHKI